MPRARAVLGLVAGASQILSSAAHSLLGWSGLKQELAAANVPPELERGVEIGWHFGGVAMLAFGIVAVAVFARRLCGQAVSTLPVAVIACAYLAFGAWALWRSDLSPFFMVFVVPGVLLALAASGPAPERR
jgi:hypothetical protein